MSLLSSPRLEAVRLIREQLRCTLCNGLFRDPQCLDCKHNFCRDCILLHMRRKESQCPLCQLPTQPSEVTRNQFLESILAAWGGVEKELQCLEDPTLHESPITVEDTNGALSRAASGTGAVPDHESHEEKHNTRGRVGNHKWNINTQEIRQELRLEQPYLPQHYGRNQGASHSKTSSSDLPDDYGGIQTQNGSSTQEQRQKVSLDEASEDTTRQEEAELTQNVTQNPLMATQEVESYLDRINKQREALSQWERNRHQGPMGLAEILGTQRRDSQTQEEESDMLTQMPMTQMPLTQSALESPDLLASFQMSSRRRSSHDHYTTENTNESDRRPGVKAKRQVQLTSPPPLYPRSRILSPSRKRLRVPSPQQTENGNSSIIPPTQLDSDDGNSEEEVPSSQPIVVASSGDDDGDDEEEEEEEEESESADDPDDSDYEVPDSQPGIRFEANHDVSEEDEGEEKQEEEEYEMKPAVPLPPTPEHESSQNEPHCERLRDLFSRGHQKNSRISDDFRSAITAFQSEENRGATSLAAQQLTSTADTANDSDATRLRGFYKPPMHANISTRTRAKDVDFVFVSSDLARDEIKRVMQACQRFGGKYGQDFDLKRDASTGNFLTSVTHLITKAASLDGEAGATSQELRCKRTAKYMRALAEGTFVMDFSWVTASLSAGRWLTEEPFEIVGDIYSDSVGKPREARIRRTQTGRRNSIFSMFCFVLLVSESEFDFQFASVRALVTNFGGRVMHSDNYERMSGKQRARRTPVGVVSKVTSPHDAKSKWHQYQIPIVRITWIFDSVSHLEVLPFDDYYPY